MAAQRQHHRSLTADAVDEVGHCLYQARHTTDALMDVCAQLGGQRVSLSGDGLYALLLPIHELMQRGEAALRDPL